MNSLPSFTGRSGLDPGGVSLLEQPATWDPIVLGWQARGGSASDTSLIALDTFLKGLRSGGLLSKVLRLNLMFGSNLSSCLLPQIVGAGNASDINNGFASGDYSESTGLTANGATKYLDSGVDFTSVTGGLGCYWRGGAISDGKYLMGVFNSGITQLYRIHQTGGKANTTFGSSISALSPNAVASKCYTVMRTSSTRLDLYENGVSVANNTASTAVASTGQGIYIFALNVTGAASNYVAGTMAGYWILDSMNSGEMLDFYNRLQSFQTALGRNV